MEIGIKMPSGFYETEKLCACGKKLWRLTSGAVQSHCPECEVKKIDAVNTLKALEREKLLHLTPMYIRYGWETISPSSREAYDQVRAWVTSWAPGKHLLMIGSQGTGKTCAARLASWELWKLGADTKYVTAIDLYQAYLNKNENGEIGSNARELLYYANGCNLLVIDEAGYVIASEPAKQFFRAFHVRLHDAGNRSMILVSNIGRDGLGVYFDKSRLDSSEVSVVIFNGESMRGVK